MENEIAVKKNEVMQTVDMDTIAEYLDSTGLTKQLQPNEKAMFINMARSFGLNPFKREIYCNVYGQGQYRQCSIVTGYEVYLKRAERIGRLNGWKVEHSGDAKDWTLEATVTIHRKDWAHPFQHSVLFREVCQTRKDGSLNRFWAKMPVFMTEKVCIAQGFRLCFPDEFGGMPYTSDEMCAEDADVTPQGQTVMDVTPRGAGPQPSAESQVEQAEPAQGGGPVYLLENLLGKYKAELSNSPENPTPYQRAMAVQQDGSPGECGAMYERCVRWLSRRGVEVP